MSPAIRQQWQDWNTKFSARSLRERALMAASGVVLVVAVFNFLALEPLAVQQKRLALQLTEARTAIKTGDAVIAAGRGQADPDEVKRSYRDELRKQIAEIDNKLQGLQKQLVPPDQVSKLLEGVLTRERGLALVSLRKLPVQRFQTTGAAVQSPDSKAAPGASDRSIYQHSFEIAIEGSYGELHGYLARLEKLPWQLFWGKLELDAGAHPRIRLMLTVHTLSLNKNWLIV